MLSGGRGKAGGVKKASTPQEALDVATKILGLTIQGFPVESVLVVEAVSIKKEFYLSFTINRFEKCIECILSASGGIDIEEVGTTNPEKILHLSIISKPPVDNKPLAQMLKAVFVEYDIISQADDILQKLYRVFYESDCTLAEINPLILTADNKLIAADAKMVFDDNALYKHPDIETLRTKEEYSVDEIAALNAHLSFVSLDGTIGCMVNGAGLAMATLDLIKLAGGTPANFLDVGGSSNPEKVYQALSIILANKKVRSILINIFGGITRCDDIATGILQARSKLDITVPMVIRLTGTNEDRGRKLLTDAGLSVATDMTEAVRLAVSQQGRAS